MHQQQVRPQRRSTTALYIYGAQLYGTRYTLLYSESILDTFKTLVTPPRPQPVFVAAEPGSQEPPHFERAAAALQHHLGGSLIGIRGSYGLTISPATLEACVPDNDQKQKEGNSHTDVTSDQLILRLNGQPLARVQRWRLLQSWRGGEFGCYEIPNQSVGSLFALPSGSDHSDVNET